MGMTYVPSITSSIVAKAHSLHLLSFDKFTLPKAFQWGYSCLAHFKFRAASLTCLLRRVSTSPNNITNCDI